MRSRENISCEKTTDSRCIKPQAVLLPWSPPAPLHRRCRKSKGVKDSESGNNLSWSVEPTPTNVLVHREKHKGKQNRH